MLQAMLSLAATRETSGDSSKGKIRMASRIKSHRKDTCTFSVFHFIIIEPQIPALLVTCSRCPGVPCHGHSKQPRTVFLP